ncbi:hypothetical protein TpMuguga_03g00396 [Theileria parva strain Muguga]|uniref:uncharacterized protein n=1 Tax=Theileria parva strain Muguga TaxID=333668 RepID=UPI001C61DB7F|nr:uncharacterized protein TpMuguga_03g00396 [Theileria parva strain Muguga]EAN31133.2 hypothetical protein TpMuguga_03g00396 [Theileria parva strain Muguga]
MERFREIIYQAVENGQKIFSKMSFNPPLSQDVHTKNLLPLLANGEAYILLRPKTQVALQLAKRKVVGKGSTVLTTHRIVFIKDQNEDFKKVFSSLSVPYSHLEHPLFVQPLLLTNHFKFTVYSAHLTLPPDIINP